ncbi:LytR/AlgR family response regulator transcription factor [Aquimarina algiphila]|uniref:LytR/AlgR family response regulator transcription factor n=1 Tax=Aquimarina algiphila TaxID=2047982 RepID=UPI00232B9592|nr:LytTR family DNA-binding domain-containing protein [Aquimarina algiphila]
MKIVVVDDEALARKRILKLLEESDVSTQIFEASSGKEAILQINTIQPDLVFLDIQMTDMTGFEVLKKINIDKIPSIIFVTAFDNFAVKAFEVEAIDFLLKPYKKERFLEALHRGIEKIEIEEKKVFKSKINRLIQFLSHEDSNIEKEKDMFLDRIVLKTGKKYRFVKVDEIKFIVSSAYYAEIFTVNDEKHVYRISMSDFIKRLDSEKFIRVNRSTIVCINRINEVISEGMGDYSIIMNDKKTFSVSKNFRNSFLKKMKIKL